MSIQFFFFTVIVVFTWQEEDECEDVQVRVESKGYVLKEMGSSNVMTTQLERLTSSTRHGAEHARGFDGKNERQKRLVATPHAVLSTESQRQKSDGGGGEHTSLSLDA